MCRSEATPWTSTITGVRADGVAVVHRRAAILFGLPSGPVAVKHALMTCTGAAARAAGGLAAAIAAAA